MSTQSIALYTTIYPGVESYFTQWCQSLKDQTDLDIDIWIGLDDISVESARKITGKTIDPNWIIFKKIRNPAKIRNNAINRIINKYDALIFSDCDDLLEPSRIQRTRALLKTHDVVGCAMNLIDSSGNDLNILLSEPDDWNIEKNILKTNIFGLTNSAYKSTTLLKCMPIPEDCALVDWYLISRAVEQKADIIFSREALVSYRQYDNNIARILPPFTEKDLLKAADCIKNHYTCLLTTLPNKESRFCRNVAEENDRFLDFFRIVCESSTKIKEYLMELNKLSGPFLWWEWVNHPALEEK